MTTPPHDRWQRADQDRWQRSDEDRGPDTLPPSRFRPTGGTGTPTPSAPAPESTPDPARHPEPRPAQPQWPARTTKNARNAGDARDTHTLPRQSAASTGTPPHPPLSIPHNVPQPQPKNPPALLADNRIVAGVIGGLAFIAFIAHLVNWYSGSITVAGGFLVLSESWKGNGFGSVSTDSYGGSGSSTIPLLILASLVILALLIAGAVLRAMNLRPSLSASLILAAGIVELLTVLFVFITASRALAEVALVESSREGVSQYVDTSYGAGIFLASLTSLAIITLGVALLVVHRRAARKPLPPPTPGTLRP